MPRWLAGWPGEPELTRLLPIGGLSGRLLPPSDVLPAGPPGAGRYMLCGWLAGRRASPASSLIILCSILIAHVAQDAVGDPLGHAILFLGQYLPVEVEKADFDDGGIGLAVDL